MTEKRTKADAERQRVLAQVLEWRPKEDPAQEVVDAIGKGLVVDEARRSARAIVELLARGDELNAETVSAIAETLNAVHNDIAEQLNGPF